MTDHCGADHHRSDDRRPDHRVGSRNGKVASRGGSEVEPAGERRTATRADLLDAIASTCPHLPRAEVRHVFEATLDEMSEALRRGEAVKLRSFGQFAVRAKRERIGRNPRTGVEVPITPRRVLTFRPSTVLLDQVNGVKPQGDD